VDYKANGQSPLIGEFDMTDKMRDAGEPVRANEAPPETMTARQTYNVVSDTVTGVNVRLRDNLIQAGVIFGCLVLGAVVGALVVEERGPGAVAGGLIGLVVGLFGSGIGLMIYRAVMHARGRHD
jgi:hypothetical protein